ncbi:GL26511 [Drosophila persimilis]|uniref:GL26511 n=1 Tax=Drosophila persimilis TaxID=7234 RepID=B4GSD8_DROPE|nr:GL26511 [Drosophila persimilis]
MDTQLKAEILPDSPEQALVKEMKRVELQLQNLDRKTLKNKNENVAQHQPASPRWSRITPTFKCFTQPWVSAKRRGAVVVVSGLTEGPSSSPGPRPGSILRQYRSW